MNYHIQPGGPSYHRFNQTHSGTLSSTITRGGWFLVPVAINNKESSKMVKNDKS